MTGGPAGCTQAGPWKQRVNGLLPLAVPGPRLLPSSLPAFLPGVLLYQWLLVGRSLGLMLLVCALVGTALNATQLVLVSRLNVRLGISDKVREAREGASG